jgi:hypothetical protein
MMLRELAILVLVGVLILVSDCAPDRGSTWNADCSIDLQAASYRGLTKFTRYDSSYKFTQQDGSIIYLPAAACVVTEAKPKP